MRMGTGGLLFSSLSSQRRMETKVDCSTSYFLRYKISENWSNSCPRDCNVLCSYLLRAPAIFFKSLKTWAWHVHWLCPEWNWERSADFSHPVSLSGYFWSRNFWTNSVMFCAAISSDLRQYFSNPCKPELDMSLGYVLNEIGRDRTSSDQLIPVFAVEMSRTPIHVDSLLAFFHRNSCSWGPKLSTIIEYWC